MIEIIIPVEQWSEQLDETIASIERHTEAEYRLTILEQPEINVAVARQEAMKNATTQYMCFLDYDSIMTDSGWLKHLMGVMDDPTCGAAFLYENWGTSGDGVGRRKTGIVEKSLGPGACMLLDLSRIPESVKWDPHIGLRNGWLGGDFEEVAWQHDMRYKTGLKCLHSHDMSFVHKGGKTTLASYAGTDRFQTSLIMRMLLELKYVKAPDDEDWFKALKYVEADPDNDCMFKAGTLRECYRDVIVQSGQGWRDFFKRRNLV